MTLKDIESLLNIAMMANNWPELNDLRQQAIRELRGVQLNTLPSIQPITIVGPVKLEQSADEHPESSPTHIERRM